MRAAQTECPLFFFPFGCLIIMALLLYAGIQSKVIETFKATDDHGHTYRVIVRQLPPLKKSDFKFVENPSIDLVLMDHRPSVTMNDQLSWFTSTEGETEYVDPQDYGYRYQFYPSPDHKWIYLERNVARGLTVAGLYKVHGSKGFSVFPNRMRFDEAAWIHYANAHRVNPSDVSKSSKTAFGYLEIRFIKWSPDSKRIYIELFGGNMPHHRVNWRGAYDVVHKRFLL